MWCWSRASANFNMRLVVDCVLLTEGVNTQTSNDDQLEGFLKVLKDSYSKETMLGTSSFQVVVGVCALCLRHPLSLVQLQRWLDQSFLSLCSCSSFWGCELMQEPAELRSLPLFVVVFSWTSGKQWKQSSLQLYRLQLTLFSHWAMLSKTWFVYPPI